MDFSKLINKLLICLCCVVLILPFYLITFTYASEDDVISFSSISNCALDGSSSSIVSSPIFNLYYLEIESGYTYVIDITYPGDTRFAYSNSIETGSTIYNYQKFNSSGSTTITINSDNFDFIFFDVSSQTASTQPVYTITRYPSTSMTNTVSNLVDNVGIGQIWDIFDISINYIVVVVLFAFGCYIIFRIIKKVSKGKEGL